MGGRCKRRRKKKGIVRRQTDNKRLLYDLLSLRAATHYPPSPLSSFARFALFVAVHLPFIRVIPTDLLASLTPT